MPSNSANKQRYHQRMQRVIDHINANLDDQLDLDSLAEVACLSRFHWHRVYRGLTGETIHATVKRLKLNRATQQLKGSGTSLRHMARIEIEQDTALSSPLEVFKTPAARYAVFAYRGPIERLGLVFNWIFGQWLPASDETPANLPALSIYFDSPETTLAEDLGTQICIPLLERAEHASKA